MRNKEQFSTVQPQKCIWMTAGVVDYKLCEFQFDCDNCGFDRAIRQRFPDEMKCTTEIIDESGYKLDESLFYHPAHIWMRVEEEGRIRIGLDDFAQRLTGRIYSIRLPEPGETIKRNDGCWSITHRFGDVSIGGGVDGLVVQKNQQLEQLPSLINSNPYNKGWAFLLEPHDLLQTLKSLYYGKKVREWYTAETNKLRGMLNQSSAELGLTLQDGGMLKDDFTEVMNTEIINKFLSARCQMASAQN
ncbi:MAG TPA: glycine cleavage system protein H [Acidobacteriota bacterium]|nr:glycine cleavage system protein H [Acidobacteriota bacterium]